MSEVSSGLQDRRNRFVATELFAIVEGQAAYLANEWRKVKI